MEERLLDHVRAFANYRRLNRWLDVGFGAGALMRAAAAEGWEVAGTEVASTAMEMLAAEGYDVHLGELGAVPLAEGSFDVVSRVEVLEHVPHPDSMLVAASKLLRPGGALYVTTPHARGISGLLLRDRWSAVAPPEHLQLYSRTGMRSALGRSGFATQSLRTHAVNPHGHFAALGTRPLRRLASRRAIA